MRFLLLALGCASWLACASAALADDQSHLAVYVDWTNDYRYAGASESNRQPVFQGGVHWLGPKGFYAGVFASPVRFRDFRKTSYEIDTYAGKRFSIDDDVLDIELLYGAYPNTAGHPSYLPPGVKLAGYGFVELSETYTHKIGEWTLSEKSEIEPRPQSHGGLLWQVGGGALYPLRDSLKLKADVSYQGARRGPRGVLWDVGVTASEGWKLRFDLLYAGTTASTADCYNTNWCKPGLVAQLTYTFAIF